MTPEQEQPIIPPYYLLIVALIGLIVTIAALLQPTFTVVGWGGLGIMVLSLLAWALMAPDQARALLTGRTLRFGGTSIIVSAVVILALMAIYVLVRGANLRWDLTQRDDFSLTDSAREAITALGSDPTVPPVRLIAFYGPAMAGQQDRDGLLFDDYVQASAGKISYQFVDPDRNPALANAVGYQRQGQIYVGNLTDSGDIDTEGGNLVDFSSPNSSASATAQDNLTNAIIQASISGNVNAYFMTVNGGLSLQGSSGQPDSLSIVGGILKDRLNWDTQEVSMVDLTAPDSPITLNDPNLDGEVMVIPGGDTPLLEEERNALTNYLDNGGHVIIFGGSRSEADQVDLAADPALNDYLWSNFGLRFNDDVVLDFQQAYQSAYSPIATDFATHPITENLDARPSILMNFTHSLSVSDTPPENVDVTAVVKSSPSSYSKSNFADLFAFTGTDNGQENPAIQTDTDPVGPFPLIAAAENSATGAKVVLVGSVSMASNGYSQAYDNLLTTINSMTWATGFQLGEFLSRTSVQSAQSLQDTPIVADESTMGTINLISFILLPFGILGLGLLVWWNSRENAQQGG